MKLAIAASGVESDRELAVRFIRSLKCKPTILLGGCWGLMGDVARSAVSAGLTVIAILPYDKVCEVRGVIPIQTGMSPNARSSILVKACDALLALGGGAGTVMEVLMAYREGKEVGIVVGRGFDSDRYAEIMAKGIDSRSSFKPTILRSPEEAARWVCELSKTLEG